MISKEVSATHKTGKNNHPIASPHRPNGTGKSYKAELSLLHYFEKLLLFIKYLKKN